MASPYFHCPQNATFNPKISQFISLQSGWLSSVSVGHRTGAGRRTEHLPLFGQSPPPPGALLGFYSPQKFIVSSFFCSFPLRQAVTLGAPEGPRFLIVLALGKSHSTLTLGSAMSLVWASEMRATVMEVEV